MGVRKSPLKKIPQAQAQAQNSPQTREGVVLTAGGEVKLMKRKRQPNPLPKFLRSKEMAQKVALENKKRSKVNNFDGSSEQFKNEFQTHLNEVQTFSPNRKKLYDAVRGREEKRKAQNQNQKSVEENENQILENLNLSKTVTVEENQIFSPNRKMLFDSVCGEEARNQMNNLENSEKQKVLVAEENQNEIENQNVFNSSSPKNQKTFPEPAERSRSMSPSSREFHQQLKMACESKDEENYEKLFGLENSNSQEKEFFEEKNQNQKKRNKDKNTNKNKIKVHRKQHQHHQTELMSKPKMSVMSVSEFKSDPWMMSKRDRKKFFEGKKKKKRVNHVKKVSFGEFAGGRLVENAFGF